MLEKTAMVDDAEVLDAWPVIDRLGQRHSPDVLLHWSPRALEALGCPMSEVEVQLAER